MALFPLIIDWKYVKSYKTEKALLKRIEEDKELYPDNYDRYIIVKTPDDRWTAIVILDKASGGYVGRYEFLKL
jgi:hypothetical protein